VNELKPIGLYGTTLVSWIPGFPEPVPLDTAQPIVEAAMALLEPIESPDQPEPIEGGGDGRR
jgi:hypothetical protein